MPLALCREGELPERLRADCAGPACPRIFNTGEEVADDDGVSAATDGSAVRNVHGPRLAGIPAEAVRQPPTERQHLLQRSTKRPREIFA
jgi:hypothetical protein